MSLLIKIVLCSIIALAFILLATTTPKLFVAITTIIGILLLIFGSIIDGLILIVAGCIFLIAKYKEN